MKKINFGDNKNIIGGRLRALRKENHLTQGELAAKMQTFGINIDQQMVSKIENNARIVTDYELACFCKALKVTVDKMLSDFHDEG